MATSSALDDDQQGYRWETEYERTWEVLQEDATGSLTASVQDVVLGMKRRRLLEKKPNLRLGMMRHVFVIVDLSAAMKDQDFKPNRVFCVLKLLELFIGEYFDQNPIGQIGIIVTRNKRAERITELSGNAKKHIEALEKLKTGDVGGEPSLQNALELAAQTLRNIPSHASREIIVLMGSLTSCDPSNIFDTSRMNWNGNSFLEPICLEYIFCCLCKDLANQMLRDYNVRCSVIGLAAEVSVCKAIAKDTNGEYGVALDESHLKDVMMTHVFPPPVNANSESFLIKMGFPQQKAHERLDEHSFCICHLDQVEATRYGKPGYFCPVCVGKYCELPVECRICGLTLVSAPHLARSYHHLFPVEGFEELPKEDFDKINSRRCFGCMTETSGDKANLFRCKNCQETFCIECTTFIHETLHTCPGCASSTAKQD